MQENLHHISTRFDEDLAQLRSTVLEMGGMIEEQLSAVIYAYQNSDVSGLGQVIAKDKKINLFEKKIDDDCIHLIVRRQPTASDLRLIFSTIKIVTDLERIGDETKRIAKLISRARNDEHYANLRHILEVAQKAVRQAMDAFARMDTTLATPIIESDQLIDDEFKSIVRQLITHMMENPRTISASIDIIWVARAIERIGDHAENIAEHVVFIVNGLDIRHPKSGE